jgi:hypothetical protein
MPIIFKPHGLLDVSTDPAQLPQTGDEYNIESGAMTRCKNLRLNENGVAKTRDGSSKLNAAAMSVDIGHISEQDGYRYSFGTTIHRDEVSIGTGYTSKEWSSIVYNALGSTTKSTFALNGTERIRIAGAKIFEWGLSAPPAIFAIAAGTGTGLTGAYNIKLTFARMDGTTVLAESNAGSAAASAVTLANQSLRVRLDVENYINSDIQETHIRIYRTLTNGLIYYLDKNVALADVLIESDYGYSVVWEETYNHVAGTGHNIAANALAAAGLYGTYSWEADYTTATDDTIFPGTTPADFVLVSLKSADTTLGSLPPTTSDRPPAGSVVLGPNYNGACFILKDNRIYFCAAKQPEAWPAAYYVEAGPLDAPLQAGCFWNGQLYTASKHEIYLVSGTGPQTYFPVGQNAVTGARGRYCMLPIKGMGIVHVGKDGLYLFNTGSDNKFTQGQFDKVFQGQTAGGMPGVGDLSTAWLIQHGNKMYFGYPSTSNIYPQHILCFDLTTNKAAYFDWGIEIPAVCVDRENERLLGVDTSGFVWHIEDATKTTDAGTAIAWDIQSKDFTLSTRAHFPRWNKYDVDASSAVSATGELILDGTTHQRHTITGNRLTKRRLIATGNGERCAIRIHGSGPVSIYTAESE